MPLNCPRSRMAFGLLVLLLASSAYGQETLGYQYFAPADVSTFGGAQEPNEGYFFQFDALYWSISAPETATVGFPNLTRSVSYGPHPLTVLDPLSDIKIETNTLDTGDLKSEFSVGSRFEFGRVEDRDGWFVSIMQVRKQGTKEPGGEDLSYQSADVVFNDPPTGPLGTQLLEGPIPADPVGWAPGDPVVIRDLPVTLYNITMTNSVETWGVEAMFLHRLRTCHGGGTFEFFAGARYLEFDDTFGIIAGDDPGGLTVPSFLANSSWDTSAQNHIIGPQVGVRWFKKRGRWMLSTEGRFLAGLNCQNIHQMVNLGPNLTPSGSTVTSADQLYQPTAMSPTAATHVAYAREWSPLVELRLEGRYQITRAISFHAGWTGFWMDNIARANSVINYTVPAMGIDMTRNKQDVLVNGLTLGFDVNR